MERTRVAIVSDVRLYREALALIVERHERLEVVGVAGDAASGLALIETAGPVIVVLDVGMVGCLAFARAAANLIPDIDIVGFAVADVDEDICAAAEAGMSAFVPREAGAEELVAAIERVGRRELLVSARTADALRRRLAAVSAQHQAASEGSDLTYREREIVGLIGRGMSNKAIAAMLHVEIATVKNHVHNLLEKLHVHRRADAAARLRADDARRALERRGEPRGRS